jgi:septal ring factor EnvC (AmiA/AmiB activator)
MNGKINVTVEQLLAKIGELTIENQMLHRHIESLERQAAEAERRTEDDGK